MARVLRQTFLTVKSELGKGLLEAARYGHISWDENVAHRDVLQCLCREPDWFGSREQLAVGLCKVFLYLDNGTWPMQRAGTAEAVTYYLGWRRVCADIYNGLCPNELSEDQPQESLRAGLADIEAMEERTRNLQKRNK